MENLIIINKIITERKRKSNSIMDLSYSTTANAALIAGGWKMSKEYKAIIERVITKNICNDV